MTHPASRILVLLTALLFIQACSSPTSSTCEVKGDCHGANEQCVEENGVKSCKVVPTSADECNTNGDCHGTNEQCLEDNGVKKCKVVTPAPANECNTNGDCHGTNEQCLSDNGVKKCKVVTPAPANECNTNGDCHGTNEQCLNDNGVKKCKVVTPAPANECNTNGDCHGTNEQCLDDNGVKKCKVVTPTPANECNTNGDCHGTNEQCLEDNGVKKCKVVAPANQCEHDSDCPGADNYCVGQDGQKACQKIQKKNIGEPCTDDKECYTGSCNTSYSAGNGFCSKPCSQDNECVTFDENRSNLCYPALNPEDKWCVHKCQKQSDCVKGKQQCVTSSGLSSAICWPVALPYTPANPTTTTGEKTATANDSGLARISFQLPKGTISYFINAWTDTIDPQAKYLTISGFGHGNNTNNYLFASRIYSYIFAPHVPDVPSMATLLVPQAPEVNKYLSDSEPSYVYFDGLKPYGTLHYQLFTRTQLGSNLDLNVYLVGLSGVTAANAASDPDLTAMFNEVKRVYQSKGMTIRNIRYFDLPKSVQTKYKHLNMQDDKNLARLLETSKSYGTSLDDSLHINVFLIADFINSPGLLGISGGIPGAPTIDGTGGSGVVFATSDLRGNKRVGRNVISGAVFTGDIIAHEMGHFLGLTHTSEIGKDKHDPYTDTQQCSGSTVENTPSYCPDYRNLMFPYAGIRSGLYLSDQQAHVMRINPLMK